MTITTRLDISWHDRTSDIPDGLWRACFGPPREGLFWFRAVEVGTFPGQFRFQFGLLHQDGVAIGIVPAFLFDLVLFGNSTGLRRRLSGERPRLTC